MKRKRIACDVRTSVILNQDVIRITKEGEDQFFEIGVDLTADIAEAVVLLMRKVKQDDPIWSVSIDKTIVYEDLTPEKSLFWLTGGYTEWQSLRYYNMPWCDCYLEFQEEFGSMIVSIIKESKTLGDIRDGFNKYLNLSVLYDFALSRGMIK